jgi:DNA helicase-2/ATP-dependent DNA helicase PcrA
MTLHGAKGLEFATVFLPGWEEGLFPHQRALDEGGESALEEERRLAYVGLTRAKRRAYITFAANRRVYNQWQTALSSRFIAELPEEHVQHTAATGLHSRSGGGAFHGRERWKGLAEEGVADGRSALRRAWNARAQGQGDVERTFAVGARVFHPKFGYGRIRSTDGDRLEIDFEKAGAKHVLAGFVENA